MSVSNLVRYIRRSLAWTGIERVKWSKSKDLDFTPFPPQNDQGKQKSPKTSNQALNVCSWNVRRGLQIREEEIKDVLSSNEVDIIFLVETDTYSVNSESDYVIQGYKTFN